MKNKTILITGFGPFPGVPDNPSEKLVKRAAQLRLADNFSVQARVLPTEFGAAGKALRQAIAEVKPDIVICFGVAARSGQIRVERAAWNTVTTERKDAAGCTAQSAVVCDGGPDGYGATLPVEKIVEALNRRGLWSVGSDSAGDYLCNAVFYELMHEIATSGAHVRGGFIHIPMPRAGKALSAGGLLDAAMIAVRMSLAAGDAPLPVVLKRGPAL